MEEIKLNGEEWAVDENCIVHAAGPNLQVSVKKSMIEKLKLGPRDVIKIYARKVGHKEERARNIKNNFKKGNIEQS